MLARPRLASVPTGIAFAVAAMVISSFGTFGFAALMPLIRDDLDLSTTLVGATASATYIAALITALPAGRLADRLGAGKLIVAAELVISAGLTVAAVAPGKVVFYVGVALMGGGYGMVTPATNLIAAGTGGARRRGWLMSVKQAGVTVGGILAGLILPWLAAVFDWRVALALPLVACAFTGLAATRLGPEAAVEQQPAVAVEGGHSGRVLVLGAYGFLMSGIQFVIFGYLAVYLVDERGQSAAAAGTELAVVFVGASVGRLLWGLFSDRFFAARASSLQLAAAGSCVMLATLPLGARSVGVLPFLAVLGFCSAGWNGVYQAVIADSAPYHSLGRATGAALVFVFLGAVTLPPAFGLGVHATASWPASWLVAAACPAAALLLLRLHTPVERIPVASGEPA